MNDEGLKNFLSDTKPNSLLAFLCGLNLMANYTSKIDFNLYGSCKDNDTFTYIIMPATTKNIPPTSIKGKKLVALGFTYSDNKKHSDNWLWE